MVLLLGFAVPRVPWAPRHVQVWYCSVKGLNPWLKPTAENTKTNDDGGHTLWYNEPQLLQVLSWCHLLDISLQLSSFFVANNPT